jgi:hypothetical protein
MDLDKFLDKFQKSKGDVQRDILCKMLGHIDALELENSVFRKTLLLSKTESEYALQRYDTGTWNKRVQAEPLFKESL